MKIWNYSIENQIIEMSNKKVREKANPFPVELRFFINLSIWNNLYLYLCMYGSVEIDKEQIYKWSCIRIHYLFSYHFIDFPAIVSFEFSSLFLLEMKYIVICLDYLIAIDLTVCMLKESKILNRIKYKII